MKSIDHPTPDIRGISLPLATLGLCAWHAFPSLAAAWGNDLYSRGAATAFVIWLLSQCIIMFGTPSLRTSSRHGWIIIALILCVTGSMSELRAIQHLALAAAVPGLLGLGFTGVTSFASAATWMPASGWFLSHVISGGLAGWERPASAMLFALCFTCIIRHFRLHPVAPLLSDP